MYQINIIKTKFCYLLFDLKGGNMFNFLIGILYLVILGLITYISYTAGVRQGFRDGYMIRDKLSEIFNKSSNIDK